MAGRQSTPSKGKGFIAGTMLLCVAAWFAGPALASATSSEICGDEADLSRGISTDQLEASALRSPLNVDDLGTAKSDFATRAVSPSRLLSPKAESALRKVFEETASPAAASPVADALQADGDVRPAAKARVPGLSDGDLARYKRQMFRRDI